MNIINNKISGLLFCVFLSSCLNDSFLDRFPKTKLTEETLFVSYDNFKTYAWQLYEIFPAYRSVYKLYEIDSDDFFKGTSKKGSDWIWQTIKVPASGGDYDFTYIRKVNLMLDNVERCSSLSQNEKNHWRAAGKFFRAYKYFDLLSKFGGIAWIDHCLTTESEELYMPRDSRDVVAGNILADLKFAEENIDLCNDGENTINKDVVQALLSRFTLFEGTWRKYHGLKDSDVYLKECERVSRDLINKHPVLHSNYDELFNSVNPKIDEILLYKDYVADLEWHSVTGAHLKSQLGFEYTKDLVDSYLCTDGKPIYEQSGYPSIEEDPYTEFRNRDKRLYYNVMLPYKIETIGNTAYEKEWKYTDNPSDREYMDKMEEISSQKFKIYPIKQGSGSVCKFSPHFTLHNGGFGFQACQGGYYPLKYYNEQDLRPSNGYSSDAPIFRMGEIFLNYAEACFENRTITQGIVDETINELRKRGGVAEISDINDIPEDSRRDPDIDPLLWEIRRERRVELLGEGFRFNDLRRWKKCEYMNKQKLGRWYSAKQLVADGVIKSESDCKIKFIDRNGKENKKAGYIKHLDDPVKKGFGWKDHYYLYPLPIDNLLLNPKLEQNPGWEDGRD